MNPTDIYIKTTAGIEELRSRGRKLSPRLRTMLIMVDGVRTAAELQVAALALGAPGDFLDVLEAEGLVVGRPGVLAPVPVSGASASSMAAPAPAQPPVAPPPAFAALPDEVERYTAARKLMNDTAVDAMGFRSFLFTLKLERCATRQDLRLLLPEFNQNLQKSRGELFARRITDHVRTLLE